MNGIEISPDRYDVAVASAKRVAPSQPGRFMSRDAEQGELQAPLAPGDPEAGRCNALRGYILQESGDAMRTLRLLEGDLAIAGRPDGPAKEADAVFLQFRLRPPACLSAYGLLQHVLDGCQAISLENISWEKTHPQASVLHPEDESALQGETQHLATSLCREGYPFHNFFADRKRSTTLSAEYAIGYVPDLHSHLLKSQFSSAAESWVGALEDSM